MLVWFRIGYGFGRHLRGVGGPCCAIHFGGEVEVRGNCVGESIWGVLVCVGVVADLSFVNHIRN